MINNENTKPWVFLIDILANDLLPANSAAFLSGRLSQTVALRTESLVAEFSSKPAAQDRIIEFYSSKLHELLSKLLSARQEPQDWQHEEYCCSVCAVLSACSAIMRLGLGMHAAVSAVMGSDVLKQITAAEEEVSLLLATLARQQQQEQQQQQDAKQQQHQQQQQQQDQQQQDQQQQQQQLLRNRTCLLDLSLGLLQWCLAAKWLWAGEHKCGSSGATFQLRAVELAAALAGGHNGADVASNGVTLDVISAATGRVLGKLDRLNPGAESAHAAGVRANQRQY
jgi:DNA segregation ATPase FtsK/SpoIIIE-like protein